MSLVPGLVLASANANNGLALIIPCHRVISKNGGLGGYAGGLTRKRQLLDLESTDLKSPDLKSKEA